MPMALRVNYCHGTCGCTGASPCDIVRRYMGLVVVLLLTCIVGFMYTLQNLRSDLGC